MKTKAVWRPSASKEVLWNANESLHRALAILKLSKVVAPIVTFALSMVTAMTNNAKFP